MRLSEKKVDYLCRKIYEDLAQSKHCTVNRAQTHVIEALKKTLMDDLKMEDALDAEVEEILEKHKDEMRARGVDYHTMFKKTKSMLARERKLVY